MFRIKKVVTPPFVFPLLRFLIRKRLVKTKSIQGYESRQLVDLIIWKNLNLRRLQSNISSDINSFRILAAVGLARQKTTTMRVLDFGGGGGHHQLIAKQFFSDIDFEWIVIETPSLVESAREKIHETGLLFSSEPIGAQKKIELDLIHSNSAVQYTENPAETIEQLLLLNFRLIFLTRIPVISKGKYFEYTQESMLSSNGPGPGPQDFVDAAVFYKTRIIELSNVKELFNMYLVSWYSIDEGPWDLGRFGHTVRTLTFIGKRY